MLTTPEARFTYAFMAKPKVDDRPNIGARVSRSFVDRLDLLVERRRSVSASGDVVSRSNVIRAALEEGLKVLEQQQHELEAKVEAEAV